MIVIRTLLAPVLAFQIAFGAPLMALAAQNSNSPVAPTSNRKQVNFEAYQRSALEEMRMNPAFEAFAQSPALPELSISRNDSAVDQNPFFLREQKWTALQPGADRDDVSATKLSNSAVALNLPAAKKSLNIPAGLTPIHFNDEYVFFTADEKSTFLEEAAGSLAKGQYATQGLFFVNYGEALTAAKNNMPVHVFFFPLPGTGWKGTIDAEELSDLDVLSVHNADGSIWLPVELNDIRNAEKIGRLNSAIGTAIALQKTSLKDEIGQRYATITQAAAKNQNVTEAAVLTRLTADISKLSLPARGSTYAFGLVATGFDLDSRGSFGLNFQKFPVLRNLMDLIGIKTAHADIGPELWDRIERFLIPFGALFVVAVGLKYSILKENFKFRRAALDIRQIEELAFNRNEVIRALYDGGIKSRAELANANAAELFAATKGKHALITADYISQLVEAAKTNLATVTTPKESGWLARQIPENVRERAREALQAANRAVPQPAKSVSKLALREGTEIIDTFATVLTFVKAIPSVVSGLTIQRLADRYIPEASAAESKTLNKVMENTFLWAKRTNSNISVNSKTFLLGAVWMGAIDTGSVAIQLLYTNPALAQAVAPYLPPSVEAKVHEAFSSDSAETRSLIVNEIVRNAIAHLTVGASSYSQETQAQIEPIIRQEVRAQMQRAGKNLDSPQVREEMETLIRDALNVRLRDLGIPDKIYFQFDLNTVDQKVLRFLGLNVDAQTNENTFGKQTTLAGQARPGLIKSSLLKAISVIREEMKTDPTPDKLAAIQILEDARQKISVLRFNWLKPLESYRQMKQVNSILTLLSYNGNVDATVRAVPELWHGVDPDGARYAALKVRQAFFFYYTGDGNLIKLPPEFVRDNIGSARRQALASITEKYGLEGQAEKQIVEQTRSEFALTVEQNLRDQFAEKQRLAKIDSYQHPKMGWYEERQHRRAYRVAADQFNTELMQSKDMAENRFAELYTSAVAREVAIHPVAGNAEEQRVLERILAESIVEAQNELKQDGVSQYLDKVGAADPKEREKIELWTLAKTYLSNYKAATIDQRLVAPRSPLQPGFTQKLRQTRYLRQSGIIPLMSNVALRGVDSLFDDETTHRSGLKAKIYRNVPFAYDTAFASIRNLKSIVPATTVGLLWLQHFWGVKFGFVTYLFAVMLNPLIMVPSQWLNRAFRQQGWEPMGGVWSKTVYGLPYAWVTFAGSIPWVMYNSDVVNAANRALSAVLTHPVSQMIGRGAEAMSPFLPALLAVPLAAEIVMSIRNRLAIRTAEAALKTQPRTERAIETRPVTASGGGGRCESLFLPAGAR